jgi:hypothetical protein
LGAWAGGRAPSRIPLPLTVEEVRTRTRINPWRRRRRRRGLTLVGGGGRGRAWSQYERAQLFTVVEVSRQETHGQDSGVEILKNEPYDNEHGKGQYTHKIYHLGSKVPRFIAAIAPANALRLEEEAWNGYPYCKTVLTNPFLGERFRLTITTKHLPDAGTQENVHGLEGKMLKDREVVYIDVANDKIEEKEYDAALDPCTWRSASTGRGPLAPDWLKTASPVMCCYKLVEMKFKVLGLESSVESFTAKVLLPHPGDVDVGWRSCGRACEQAQRHLFLMFHRKLVCYMDKWFPLTMVDIRALEAEVKEELAKALAERQHGHAQPHGNGHSAPHA